MTPVVTTSSAASSSVISERISSTVISSEYFGAAAVDAAAGISTTTGFNVCAVSARSVTAGSAGSEGTSCAFWGITGSGSEAAAPPLNACSRLMASETLSVCWVV